jgi:hypothetical protein
MQKHAHSKFVKWSLVVGIVIVLNLFFNYAISLFYTVPQYPTAPQVVRDIATEEECVGIGGQWTENSIQNPTSKVLEQTDQSEPTRTGYCDPDYTKRNQYDDARKLYEKNIFIALVILGIVSIISGVAFANEILSSAFSWGGVLSLVIASMRYWTSAGNKLKVLILAIALGALIWTALRKFSEK